jgi:hypothetical protein
MVGHMGGPELPPLEQALVDAAENGLNKEILRLLAEGADIHTDHDCPLRLAAYYNHMDTAKILLDRGADIHALDDETLWWVVASARVPLTDNTRFMEFLIERGADVQAHNNRAVRKAAQSEMRDNTLLLLRHGADPLAKDAIDGKDSFHNTDLDIWLEEVRQSLAGKFSVPPIHEQCFSDDGRLKEQVLDACLTGQFEYMVSVPLLASGDEDARRLFADIWHALPACWQGQHQNSYVQFLKSENRAGPHAARIQDKPSLTRSVA